MPPKKLIHHVLNPTTLATVLGLQFIRLLFPGFVFYLRDTSGWASLNLAPLAIGVFGATILIIPLVRLLGIRNSGQLLVALLAIFRVAEYLSRSPLLDLLLAAGGVITFGMFISLVFQTVQSENRIPRTDFGADFLFGVALDTAILTGGATLDLSWQTNIFAALVVFILSMGLLYAWGRSLREDDSPGFAKEGPFRAWPLLALGPYLFLQLLIFQNIGLAVALTGWSLPAAGLWIWLGNLCALLAYGKLAVPSRWRMLGGLISGAALILVLAGLYRTERWLAAASLLFANLLAAYLWGLALRGLNPSGRRPSGRDWIPMMSTLALLLFVIFSFLYYVSYDLSLGFRGPALLPVIGGFLAVLALASARQISNTRAGMLEWAHLAPISLLAVPPLVLGMNWRAPGSVDPRPENDEVRVMTYNLHQGFSTSGALNIEALAAVIEDSGADIVALQEVTRSYVTNGSLDMLSWLSQRLDMPYYWGPTDPPQWGVALLSRYPILQAQTLPLPPDTLNLRRGYIDATVDAGGGTIRILATHLHHLEPDSDIRQLQVSAILAAWDGSTQTVILGDLNAVPGDPEMRMIAEAGFLEVAAALGLPAPPTFYSEDPDRQIDYIWVTPDLQPLNLRIPLSLASDHLPLVAEIQVP